MENIPQPADTPYTEGDTVRIYLGEDDEDARFHGLVCRVMKNVSDDLGEESGRALDSCQYDLRRVDTKELLPISFRHFDLVPVEEWPEGQ